MSTGSGRAGVECGDQASPERGVNSSWGRAKEVDAVGKKAICVYVPVPQPKQFQKIQVLLCRRMGGGLFVVCNFVAYEALRACLRPGQLSN